jgi:hypothetical protein
MPSHLPLSLRSSIWRAALLTAAAGLAGVGSAAAQAPAPPPWCALHLIVAVTPDVPNPRDPGFVSSLLGDNTGYRLTLRRMIDDTHLDMRLYGPGPKRNCRSVVDSMRKDARVSSIQVQ